MVEEYVADLHRHCLIARLVTPGVGSPIAEVPALYDATLLRWSSDHLTFTGFERIPDEMGLKVLDFAQTWQVVLEEKT